MNKFSNKAAEFFSGEKFSSVAVTALVIAVTVVINALLYTVASVFGLVYYYTEKTDYSLTGSSDGLFDEAIKAGKKVKIRFCMSEDELKAHSTGNEVYITAKKFEEKYPDFIEIDYINLFTKQDKNGNYVDVSKYKTSDNVPIFGTSVIFECGENNKVITDVYTSTGFSPFYTMNSSMYITSYNGEEIISSMVSWVTYDEHKKAYFTQRHGEQVDTSFANLLVCAGYEIDTVDLRKNSVPDDAALLIIMNPTSDFEASKDGTVYTETDKLAKYLDGGGNLYVALDPYVKTLTVLEDFLLKYGIKFSTTENDSGKKIRNIVKESRNAITTDGFTFVCGLADSEMSKSVFDRISDNSGVLIKDVSALELSGNAKPILTSSGTAVLEAGGKTISETGSYCVAAYSEKQSESGATSRVFVVPSIYLSVSDALVSEGYSNKDFIYSLIEGMFWDKTMPYGCRPISYSSQILQNLTMGKAKLYTAIALLVPASIALVGTVVLVRRKNR